jgi:hypothetical protein
VSELRPGNHNQESWNADTSALEAEVEQSGSATPPPKRERAGRQPLPEDLPRIEHRHEPESCTCGQCGKDLVKIGEDRHLIRRPEAKLSLTKSMLQTALTA